MVVMFTSVVASASEGEQTEILVIDTTQSGITITDSSSLTNTPDNNTPLVSNPLEQSPADRGFFPFEIRYETHNGAPVIIMSFRVPVDTDPSVLVERDFEDSGHLFSMRHILLADTITNTEQKVVAQTVSFVTEEDGVAVMAQVLTPLIDFNEGGFVGQLELDRTSIQSIATGMESYSFPIRRVVEIANLDRNDLYSVPRSEGSLTLQDVTWLPEGGQMRGDIMLPEGYTAQALYAGVGRGERATGFENIAVYRGTVSRSVESENVFSVIYHGVKVAPDSSGFPFSLNYVAVAVVSILVTAGVLFLVLTKVIPVRRRGGLSDVPPIDA